MSVEKPVLFLEDLTHIRENIANGSKFQQWAYAKFVELVEYRVESTELFVDSVNPAYTTRRSMPAVNTAPGHDRRRSDARTTTAGSVSSSRRERGDPYCRRYRSGESHRRSDRRSRQKAGDDEHGYGWGLDDRATRRPRRRWTQQETRGTYAS